MTHKYRLRRDLCIPRPNVTLDEVLKALNYGLVHRDGDPPARCEDSTLEVTQHRGWGRLGWHVRAHVKIVHNSATATKLEVSAGHVKFWNSFFVDEVCELLDEARELAAGHGPTQTERYSPDNLISLLGVYTMQFGSYTTLLWQVPALSLTAQSFLMTIALGYHSSNAARLIASVLSAFIAGASFALMHHQRGRAINHGELAKKLSEKLELAQLLGRLEVDDAQPKTTNAERVWTVDHIIYQVWKVLMILFSGADIVVLALLVLQLKWFN